MEQKMGNYSKLSNIFHVSKFPITRIILKKKGGSTDTTAFKAQMLGQFICLTYDPPAKTDMVASINSYVS